MDGQEEEPKAPAAVEKSPKARGPRVTILTNLPEKLPVIEGEVALIHAFLGELVARLAVNDNGDDP
jgi:hypothetical protein